MVSSMAYWCACTQHSTIECAKWIVIDLVVSTNCHSPQHGHIHNVHFVMHHHRTRCSDVDICSGLSDVYTHTQVECVCLAPTQLITSLPKVRWWCPPYACVWYPVWFDNFVPLFLCLLDSADAFFDEANITHQTWAMARSLEIWLEANKSTDDYNFHTTNRPIMASVPERRRRLSFVCPINRRLLANLIKSSSLDEKYTLSSDACQSPALVRSIVSGRCALQHSAVLQYYLTACLTWVSVHCASNRHQQRICQSSAAPPPPSPHSPESIWIIDKQFTSHQVSVEAECAAQQDC